MVRKGEPMSWALHLEIHIPPSESQGLHGTLRMWQLDVVVGRDGSLDVEGSSTDLLGLLKKIRFKVRYLQSILQHHLASCFVSNHFRGEV